MATTGFWPVKDRLKEVIDYAENPDKTIDQKYMDKDLYAACRKRRTLQAKRLSAYILKLAALDIPIRKDHIFQYFAQ